MSEGQSTPEYRELTVDQAVELRTGSLGQESASADIAPEAPERTDASLEEAATDSTEVEEVETSEEDTSEEETEESTEEEDQDDPVSEDESDETSEDATEDEEVEEPEAAYTIEVDGKLVEVTLDELKRGHLRESDYTRKTQELAEERKAVTTRGEELTQSIDATALIMEMALQASGDELAQFSQIDWDALQRDDPYEFGVQRQAYMYAAEKREGLEANAGKIVAAQQQLAYQSTQARLVDEQAKLIQAIPDMADVKAGPERIQSILTYATDTMGLTASEANNIVDHRVVVALDKARQFDEMSAKVKSVGGKKRSKAPSRTVKAGAPKSKSGASRQKVSDLKARAKASGSEQDAVNALVAERNLL